LSNRIFISFWIRIHPSKLSKLDFWKKFIIVLKLFSFDETKIHLHQTKKFKTMIQNSISIVKQTMKNFCLLCVCFSLEFLLSEVFSNESWNWSNISKWSKLKFFVLFSAIKMLLNSAFLSHLQFCPESLWLCHNLMFKNRDKVKFYHHIDF
jgi:hypothetical protein